MTFNETQHPRTPSGSPDGGKFAAKPGGGEAQASLIDDEARWDRVATSMRTINAAALVDQLRDLNDVQVEALRSAGQVQYFRLQDEHRPSADAAIAALRDEPNNLLADVDFLVDRQDDVAQAHPDPDLHESEALDAANAAIYAVAARDTGNLSQKHFEELIRPWERVFGPMSAPPVDDPSERDAIEALDLPAIFHDPEVAADLEHVWATGEGGSGRAQVLHEQARNAAMREDLVAGRIKPRHVIGTGYKGNTRKLANEHLDRREAELSLALATRGRSLELNQRLVLSRRAKRPKRH